ncbi:helix-turn-helix transcriptional regulator [Methylobacterium sp. Leaf456]|uniref:helix-turn-helix domain-containing protein n=1 Tax=Methylobacterium sp. Leaf456 TaxID=1736382 RepID=UPI0009E7F96E|nr:helix-turn-helix transcriptional regulator [Methylobacterium sp. Leaf456]
MPPDDFKAWRLALGYSQAEAAAALGLSRATIQLYERGQRHEDARPVEIPPAVILACDTLSLNRAAETGNLDLLTGPVRQRVEALAGLLRKA